MQISNIPIENLLITILGLMNNLTARAYHVEDGISELLRYPEFYNNVEFNDFMFHFKEGLNHHHKVVGYLDSLIASKNYDPTIISLWYNKFVSPSVDHFKESFTHLSKLKTNPMFLNNPTFNKLLRDVNDFQRVFYSTIEQVRRLNLPY